MANYTKTQLSNLQAFLKQEFINVPALEQITSESGPEFPARWIAKRMPASIRLIIDGSGKDLFIEIPA